MRTSSSVVSRICTVSVLSIGFARYRCAVRARGIAAAPCRCATGVQDIEQIVGVGVVRRTVQDPVLSDPQLAGPFVAREVLMAPRPAAEERRPASALPGVRP